MAKENQDTWKITMKTTNASLLNEDIIKELNNSDDNCFLGENLNDNS